LSIDITLEKQDDFCSEVRKILKNEMNELAMKCVQSLGQAMRDKDSDEIKIKMDMAAREQAKKATEEAKEKTSDLKDKMFEDTKKKDQEMKVVE
jgi:hypothetical protein